MKDEKPKRDAAEVKNETISEGIAFLLEMEQVNNAPVQNALVLNIFKVSKYIDDVQILADQEARKMLIYLKLNWWGRRKHEKRVAEDVIAMLAGVLPNFAFRVVYDWAVFEKGLKMAEKIAALRGRLGPRI